MLYIKNILLLIIIIAVLVIYVHVDTIGNEAWKNLELQKALFLYYIGLVLITIWSFLLGITGRYGMQITKRMLIIQAIIVLIFILNTIWVQIRLIFLPNFLKFFFNNPSIKIITFAWLGLIIAAIVNKYFIEKNE
ncbi:hypothetical protein Dtox_1552 [Desulfofarcimen acetoxidans DSM 771]|uniref:Uncharacterized protein n=1 Tax=Desulfofarcimen acetoxidans (strain ATCC 49208 / DSM 771 / KCTC 5769 / VKM B-1644 / 5575) TaxID=485916 RepID=C8VW63_DESAS|nr:hypothetical protein [Desulfofarcimen acetoxidans]ACV62415.1 hypothetical protein Dtox_1552 [Desulfofarcimen acetoxidans DSM 771]